MKPWLTEDPRGPWEILWHGFLDTTTSDRYTLFVYGKLIHLNQFLQLDDWAQTLHFLLMHVSPSTYTVLRPFSGPPSTISGEARSSKFDVVVLKGGIRLRKRSRFAYMLLTLPSSISKRHDLLSRCTFNAH